MVKSTDAATHINLPVAASSDKITEAGTGKSLKQNPKDIDVPLLSIKLDSNQSPKDAWPHFNNIPKAVQEQVEHRSESKCQTPLVISHTTKMTNFEEISSRVPQIWTKNVFQDTDLTYQTELRPRHGNIA